MGAEAGWIEINSRGIQRFSGIYIETVTYGLDECCALRFGLAGISNAKWVSYEFYMHLYNLSKRKHQKMKVNHSIPNPPVRRTSSACRSNARRIVRAYSRSRRSCSRF